MEFHAVQKIIKCLSILLLIIHTPEFGGHQHGTTARAPEKDLNSSQVIEACVAIEIKDKHKYVQGVKAISDCPRQTDSDLVAKCVKNYHYNLSDIEIEDITLVSDASIDRIYRNKHCSECNFVNPSSLLYWQPGLECSHSLELPMITSSMQLIKQIVDGEVFCNITFKQPNIDSNIQYCTHSISVCNFTGLWDSNDPDLDKACALHESVVCVENGPYFRNVFCARCNGYNETLADICPSSNITPTPVNFTGFLRLSDSIQDNNSCGKNEQYDRFKEKCRQIVCSAGRELKNGRCELIYDGILTMDLDINLRLDPQDPIPLNLAYDIVPTIKSVVLQEIYNRVDHENTICGIQIILQSDILRNETTNRSPFSHKMGEVANQTYDSELLFYLLRVQIAAKGHLKRIVKSLKSLNSALVFLNRTEIAKMYWEQPLPFFEMKLVQDINKLKFEKIASLRNSTFQGKDIKNGVIDINYIISQSISLSMFNDTNSMFQIPYLHLNNRFDEYCRHAKLRYPLMSLKSCPMFKAKLPFEWEDNVNGYEVEDELTRRFGENYTSVVDTQSTYILICADTYFENLEQPKRSVIDGGLDKVAIKVLLHFCFSASLICMIFSLVTYCMFKQLRTLPGKNNIALIVSLIFYQVFQLVSLAATDTYNAKIVMIFFLLSWYFSLVSLFWMNICTFHICQVLLKPRTVSQHGICRRYCYYHLYCISMSLIVFAVIIGTFFVFDYFSTQPLVGIFISYFPVVFVLVSNFGMFLAVIISLKRRPSTTQSVRNDRNYIVIFIKLSTVTGITWLFDLLFRFTFGETYMYIYVCTYIILNGSVGIFIMLAFICNKRTMALYKELLRGRDGSA